MESIIKHITCGRLLLVSLLINGLLAAAVAVLVILTVEPPVHPSDVEARAERLQMLREADAAR